MSYDDDMAICRAAIATGSRSFHAASRLLPASMRDPAFALYAFCRIADDAVDLGDDKPAAVLHLRDRLDRVYAGRPMDRAADRAFAEVVARFEMPRVLPDALIEGLAWDALGHRYATLSDLRAYSARVASAVGVMMCVLMGVRDRDALARAADLGVAMQLTNIARDVGEDARAGRLYLPTEWFAEAGRDPDAFLAAPRFDEGIAAMVRALLREADRLYIRSEAGIAMLPRRARPGIFAARHIYAGIGGAVRRGGHDSITRRARTGGAAKAGWLALSAARGASTMVMPRSAVLYAPPLSETAFLVAAAGRVPATTSVGERLAGLFAELERQDRARRAA